MPGRAPGPASLLEEQLFRKVPDMFRAPEIGEQLAERERGDQLIQPPLCEWIGVIDVRPLHGAVKQAMSVGPRVLDAPVKDLPAHG